MKLCSTIDPVKLIEENRTFQDLSRCGKTINSQNHFDSGDGETVEVKILLPRKKTFDCGVSIQTA